MFFRIKLCNFAPRMQFFSVSMTDEYKHAKHGRALTLRTAI